MRGINKVILIGNAGKDPEIKSLPDGTPVAKIALATEESFRLKNGEISRRTDWHTIILWRGLADIAAKFVKKGSLLYVEGKLRNRQYEDKEGLKKFVTEVVAEQIVLLDKKEKGNLNEDGQAGEIEEPF